METKGGFFISQIKQIQDRVFTKLLAEAGIEEFNGAQGRILYVLWLKDNLPIVELADRTGLAKTTLTSMLERLEQQGHICRVFDEMDRRKIRIILTEQAKALQSSYTEVSDKMTDIFYQGFTGEEILIFEEKLDRILSNLKVREKQ
jgi:DNA-binding MarR family transcriptional regulator